MVTTQRILKKQALKLSVAAAALIGLGAAVVAAPFAFETRTHLTGDIMAAGPVNLAPLGVGPAIQLARANGDAAEDCVVVTKMTGPDGKVYPTRGVVCGGAE